jgi:Tfp pilus assembly protein PilZ
MRKEIRQAMSIDLHLEVKIKNRPGLYTIMDLSTFGALIYSEKASQFELGDDIKLIMKLPEIGETLEITAQVARVTRKANGVEFTAEWTQDPKIIEYCFNAFKNTLQLPST